MIDYLKNTNKDENQQPRVAGLYARVSTGRQEKEETIESQIDEIKIGVEQEGNILRKQNYFVDDGWTSELLARPALDQLRNIIKEGQIGILYVYDLGRLTRVFHKQLLLIEEIKNAGVKLISLHDINATTYEEELQQRIFGIFHDYERIKIAERMRRGKLYRAKNGILINGSAKYGWRYIRKIDTASAYYKVNEDQAKVVSLVWDWYGNQRLSVYEIIRRLYDMGIKPPKGKSPFWVKTSIVRMLQCESYHTGIIYYNKSEAVVAKNPIKNRKYRRVTKTSRKTRSKEEWLPYKVDPIIKDFTLYQKIQKRLEYNKKYARKNRKYGYLLTELIYCACGNRRVGDGCSKNGHFYYRCIERIKKFPLKHKCVLPGVNAEILDAITWQELVEVLTQPRVLKECVNKWMQIQANNDYEEIERQKLNVAMDKITEEEKRYAKAYGSGMLEFEQFQEVMKDAKKRKLAIQKQVDELMAKSSQATIDVSTEDYLKYAEEYLKKLDFSNKLQVVRDIIGRVTIKERSGVEVLCHIPLSQLSLTSAQELGHDTIGRNSRFT